MKFFRIPLLALLLVYGTQVPSLHAQSSATASASAPSSSGPSTSPATPMQQDHLLQGSSKDDAQDTRREADRTRNGADHSRGESDRTRKEEEAQAAQRNTHDLIVPPPTEFQLLVQRTTENLLPIFGASLFTHAPSTFAPADNIPVPPEYVLGPGDEVVLNVWGQVRISGRYIIDRTGDVSIPGVGTVHLAGLPYAQLQDYLRNTISRIYKNFELTAALGQLRSIQIFVVGNAVRPGAFTVSALSTLVNALFVSGGPAPNGSLRRIQLRRMNKTVVEFDLYDLLLHGDKSKDIKLLAGDVLFIPPVGDQVALAGSVKNPAIYELKDEKSVAQVLQLAGGLTVTAANKNVRLERIDARRERSVADFNLPDNNVTIRSGDILIFSSITDRFRNAVTLRGNVQNPGRYVWFPGMRIRDLIPDKAALITRDYDRAHNQLGLMSNDDYTRPQEGSLTAAQPTDTNGDAGQKASAAVTVEGNKDTFVPRNDVVLSAADVNLSYAVIERLDSQSLTTTLIPFNLGKAVLEGDPANNLELKAGDVVTIFSKADIPVPQSQRTRFIKLEGEFVSAGIYSVLPGETLRSVIRRAGGLTPDAYLYGSEFTRESTRRLQQQRWNEYLDDLETQLNQAIARTAQNTTLSQPTFMLSPAALARMRSMRASGRIVLAITPNTKSIGEIPDIELEDGDRFVVPRMPATVGVAGSVYNASNFLYRSPLRAGDYLKMAGGPSRQADEGREFIIRADGSIVSRQYHSFWRGGGFSTMRIYPGDTVVVPAKVSGRDAMRTLLDVAQIVGQFGIGVAAINVLR